MTACYPSLQVQLQLCRKLLFLLKPGGSKATNTARIVLGQPSLFPRSAKGVSTPMFALLEGACFCWRQA